MVEKKLKAKIKITISIMKMAKIINLNLSIKGAYLSRKNLSMNRKSLSFLLIKVFLKYFSDPRLISFLKFLYKKSFHFAISKNFIFDS